MEPMCILQLYCCAILWWNCAAVFTKQKSKELFLIVSCCLATFAICEKRNAKILLFCWIICRRRYRCEIKNTNNDNLVVISTNCNFARTMVTFYVTDEFGVFTTPMMRHRKHLRQMAERKGTSECTLYVSVTIQSANGGRDFISVAAVILFILVCILIFVVQPSDQISYTYVCIQNKCQYGHYGHEQRA